MCKCRHLWVCQCEIHNKPCRASPSSDEMCRDLPNFTELCRGWPRALRLISREGDWFLETEAEGAAEEDLEGLPAAHGPPVHADHHVLAQLQHTVTFSFNTSSLSSSSSIQFNSNDPMTCIREGQLHYFGRAHKRVNNSYYRICSEIVRLRHPTSPSPPPSLSPPFSLALFPHISLSVLLSISLSIRPSLSFSLCLLSLSWRI